MNNVHQMSFSYNSWNISWMMPSLQTKSHTERVGLKGARKQWMWQSDMLFSRVTPDITHEWHTEWIRTVIERNHKQGNQKPVTQHRKWYKQEEALYCNWLATIHCPQNYAFTAHGVHGTGYGEKQPAYEEEVTWCYWAQLSRSHTRAWGPLHTEWKNERMN